MSFKHWFANVALITDDEINVLFGGAMPGDPVQGTISLRAAAAAAYGRGYKRWLGKAMCGFLGRFEKDHCANVLRSAGK